jgi:xanthine dehydrogenase accessory factor
VNAARSAEVVSVSASPGEGNERGGAMSHEALMELAREFNRRAEPYALVTVVRAVAPTSAWLGAQAIVLADGTLHGWIGGGCARGVVIGAARGALDKGEPRLIRISNDRLQDEAELEQHTMQCASNGTIELFIQPYSARIALCVLGSTPAADEARFLAERYRIRLTEAPGEAPVVLVATQGQGDEEALEAALRSPAAHVLMIASRRKAEKLREAMRLRGIGEAQLARLQAPAGPDAGAKTPGEIALVAIVAVLALLRGRDAEPAGADASSGGTSAAPASAQSVPAPAGKGGPGEFMNPVCGMAVRVADALHVELYAGVPYYFCCDGCWTTFRDDPAKYAAIHLGSAAGAAG